MADKEFVSTLPEGFQYRLIQYNQCEGSDKYCAEFYASLEDTDDITRWVEDFSRLTSTNWTVTCSHSRLTLATRKDYSYHLYRDRSEEELSLSVKSLGRFKDNGCPATIRIKIGQVNARSRRRYDWVRDGMPAKVELKFTHNHPCLNASILSYRRIDPNVKTKSFSYFSQCMSPSMAAAYHLDQLELDPDIVNIVEARADASINPSFNAISHIYKKWRKINLGGRIGESMWTVLEEKLIEYQAAGVKIITQKDSFCIAVLTPLMQRAHELPSASEICFVDSTASCDADNHVITFLLVLSPHGAVPAGILLTQGQSQEDYCNAFAALAGLLQGSGFGGQGYPAVFITDDSAAEQARLKAVWPSSLHRLCHFHVLQSVWRWLWAAKHGINLNDRQPLMQCFRKVLYATDESTASELLTSLMSRAEKYENFQHYIGALWERRQGWSVAHRRIAAMRGHHTNNFAEVTVRIFKDNVLTRCKAYNAVALLDLIVTVLEKFYRNRLEQYANGRVTVHKLHFEKLMQLCSYITCGSQIQKSTADYLVPSKSTPGLLHHVEPISGLCTCVAGMSGRCCKHQAAVFKFYHEALRNMPATTTESRYTAAYIAVGSDRQPYSFCLDLKGLRANQSTELEVNQVIQEPCVAASTVHEIAATEPVLDQSYSKAELMSDVQSVCSDFVKLMEEHGSDSNAQELSTALNILRRRFSNIHTPSQLVSFLHTSGSSVPLRRRAGAQISVQPTSIARRRPKVTRGAKRLRSGRPPKGIPAAKRRPRNLGYNISKNQPNAISHGFGH